MKKPLYYTFGNHMHWVDMQWLWGYDVLPSSVRDMLHLIAETGVKGNVNFDGVGYERMASEAPEALSELRAAVRAGQVEIVGGSYGQPYGLFHGGESNVRQRVFGVRSALRLFGVRPRAFWEEEFDFFPQLPQMLASCGYEGASLFFQWTWHTPTVPEEDHALVLWEGLDGTRLPALPKNALCLHQWPEDFDGRLESELAQKLERPALLQWLELLPSPDWMCRSEVLLPRLKELLADPRFEVRPATLSELIAALQNGAAPVRRYGMDDVFHGVSLGKNGDYMPRYSRMCEEQLLAAESLSALAGLFGRPYASWDVYPTWELEEAWRELLCAQHHDVHECEGLCGSIGERSFERSLALSSEVFLRTLEHLGRRVDADEGSTIVFNPLGWTRDVAHQGGVVRDVPAFGYKVIDPYDSDQLSESRLGEVRMWTEDDACVLARGRFRVEIDRKRGLVRQIVARDFPEGILRPDQPSDQLPGALQMKREGKLERFATVHLSGDAAEEGEWAEFQFVREGRGGSQIRVTYGLAPLCDALWIRLQGENLARPDPGMHAGLSTLVAPALERPVLFHDHPFGIGEIRAEKNHVRKYPSGEWMTSPQWFEDIVRPFTALSLLDQCEGGEAGRGLLLVHDGSQALFREEHGVRVLLSMYDPWDEEIFDNVLEAELWLVPHGRLTHTERMRLSMECNLGSPRFEDNAVALGGGDLPATFGALSIDAPSVLATAFYRESRKAAEGLPRHFNAGSDGARDPFVLRLVEFDGRPADVVVRLPGPVARAARTSLLGEVIEELSWSSARAPFGPSKLPWSAIRLRMRPHEIATLHLDLELGRQVPRNLDEHRHVWATVHREKRG